MGYWLEGMIRNVGHDSLTRRAHLYDNFCSDTKKPCYPKWSEYTWLLVILKLFNLRQEMGGLIKVSHYYFSCWVTCFLKVTHCQYAIIMWGNIVSRGYEVSRNLCMSKWLSCTKARFLSNINVHNVGYHDTNGKRMGMNLIVRCLLQKFCGIFLLFHSWNAYSVMEMMQSSWHD